MQWNFISNGYHARNYMESKLKTIVTITGIRPDFIRMSEIFKKLDKNFNHILCHSGQHYEKMLSEVFFEELDIRKPDYNLEIGGVGKEHFHQTAELSVKVIELFRKEKIDPDVVLFLGDSNSVMCAPILKKEGYRIAHCEAGMRSFDKRMLEEINRTCCDHCSDFLFVYHEDYKQNLAKENIHQGVHVVGNTIVEVCNNLSKELLKENKRKDFILLDIHRPENFKYKNRLQNIFDFANYCSELYKIPVKALKFGRTINALKEFSIITGNVQFVDLMSYKNFLKTQYHSKFMISDSGTAQEEPALLNTPVIVPRDFTERPQSYANNCSYKLNANDITNVYSNTNEWIKVINYIEKIEKKEIIMDTKWLGNGTTSDQIINILNNNL